MYEPVFYPDYFELAVALGLIAVSFVLLWCIFHFVSLCNDYNRLARLSRFDLYIELTRCFSAMTTCAARDNDSGAHYAARRVWLISLLLRKGEYSQYDKALAEAYFENYLALFRVGDRGGDAVAYEKEWRDRWSRKPISAPIDDQQEELGKEDSHSGTQAHQPRKRVYA